MEGCGSHLSVGWSGLGAPHSEHLAALLVGAVVSGPHAAQWACGEGNMRTATDLDGVNGCNLSSLLNWCNANTDLSSSSSSYVSPGCRDIPPW